MLLIMRAVHNKRRYAADRVQNKVLVNSPHHIYTKLTDAGDRKVKGGMNEA